MDGGRVIQKRDRLQVVVIIALMLVVITLLFSGMVYKSGDLVRSEHYSISLLRFCLQNETTASMVCLSLNEMEAFNVSMEAMAWARLFIHGSFVTSLFTPLTFSVDACLCEVHVWGFGIFLAILSYLLIMTGVALFIFAIWNYAAVLNLTASFCFCIIAGALLGLVVYTAWHFRPYRRNPEESMIGNC
uniref:Uncharacterized protein n=1 Tax=Erpetoichthys calabaricus TaxID=27687 RepID=A0A8C4RIC4_ERPCA